MSLRKQKPERLAVLVDHDQTLHQRRASHLMSHENLEALQLLRWTVETHQDRVALASSFGAEDVVLIDLLSQVTSKPRVFTLDTGRLHPETYQLMEQVERRYNLEIEVHFPKHERVEQMVRAHGINLFYLNVQNRKLCCHIRKVEPLERALKNLSAWITGLRRQQSSHRSRLSRVEVEPEGRVKINPLADWSEEQVWEYIRRNRLPYNKLHDLNYPSIGCAPCTRPRNVDCTSRATGWSSCRAISQAGHSLYPLMSGRLLPAESSRG
jgi:phosphoadenosine phosphosulfate reductase